VNAPVIDPATWPLDPAIAFLNHGSFGSCPRAVLALQQRLRERLERQPVQFFMRDLEAMVDAARAALAQFVGAHPDDLVFVPNATVGVNTVLHSLRFEPGDELLVTDHEYNACRNAFEHAAERSGARVVVVPLPFPLRSAEEIVAAILERVTPRTRLALIDHVTSQTGLVMPIETLVRELHARGVDTVVDGAHAPGMVPLDLRRVGAAYYTGNCHKWVCAPKGAAFLCVRRDRQHLVRPLVISHGANSERTDRSRYLIEFGWTGTGDPTASLCVPEALHFMGSLLPGGWPEVMRRNRELALGARHILCAALAIEPPAPEDLIGTLVSVPLANGKGASAPDALHLDPLQERLLAEHAIEVPVITWPRWPRRLLRISAQLYNSVPQYERLAAALRTLQ
jgi:isopenicillin-N epimerase